ncbi:sigma-70 family RNA polymerase sigma factor [Candidatus Uhrbacteria bacterium]|nr:sigma-70 family RNA polymerase sigma factor [Candidatus Uhrbacteria bacterium]
MLEGEERLIAAAKQGDADCFGRLYDHYIPPIYRFIFMKVTNREEAEDLTHEVFLSAWQHLHRYTSRGFPFSSWLYQIARNRVIDHYRGKRQTVAVEVADTEGVVDPISPDAQIDQSLDLETVRVAMRGLTHDQQDVIILKFLEDLPHREIAATLSKSEGAVRLIQHRALTELRRRLGNTSLS